jgi:hypothetical protein
MLPTSLSLNPDHVSLKGSMYFLQFVSIHNHNFRSEELLRFSLVPQMNTVMVTCNAL